MSSSSISWITYYERLGDAYIACSSYGITGALPLLSNKNVLEALASGSILFQDQNSQILNVFDGHVFVIPESTIVPNDIFNEIRRIGSLSLFSNSKFRLYPLEYLKNNSALELIHLGLSRNYLYGSFFILNTEVLTGNAITLCPHANPDLMNNELRSVVLSILGSSGHALSLKTNASLCVFYSHTVIDAELVITQIAKTLLRSLSSKETDVSLVGDWFSAKLSDERTESGLNSFIESVGLRLKI